MPTPWIRNYPPPPRAPPPADVCIPTSNLAPPLLGKHVVAVVVTMSRTNSKANKTANHLLKKLVIRSRRATTLANVTVTSCHGTVILSRFIFRVHLVMTPQSPSWQSDAECRRSAREWGGASPGPEWARGRPWPACCPLRLRRRCERYGRAALLPHPCVTGTLLEQACRCSVSAQCSWCAVWTHLYCGWCAVWTHFVVSVLCEHHL